MPIYKQTTEITNIDGLLSSVERDIEEVYFGDKQVFTVWAEYDGTLPAQYAANGDYLADYRVYGSVGGVGVRTENILDGNLITNEYPSSTFGKITYNLKPNTSYVLYTSAPRFGGGALLAIISSTGSATTASNGAWDGNPRVWESDSTGIINILFRGNNSGYDLTQYNYMLIEGSIAPTSYVPYGYEVDMSTQENLCDIQGRVFFSNLRYNPIGEWFYQNSITSVLRIPCEPSQQYTFSFDTDYASSMTAFRIFETDSDDIPSTNIPTVSANMLVFLSYQPTGKKVTVTTSATAKYLLFQTTAAIMGDVLNELRITTGSPITTPIYVGSSPLGEDEYVDYGEGKIYRMSGGVLTPTDPPVPFPALPTIDGTTITDYAGQSAAPTEFYAKYRKQNF